MNAKSEIVRAEIDQFPVEPDKLIWLAMQSRNPMQYMNDEYLKLYGKYYEQEQTIDHLTRN